MRSSLRKKLLWFAVGLGAIALLVYAFLPAPLEVDVATATRGSLLVTVDEDGKTRLRERYVVAAPLAGQLMRIELRPGDPVRVNQTLLVVSFTSSSFYAAKGCPV
jgi:HlyD family secretion protein